MKNKKRPLGGTLVFSPERPSAVSSPSRFALIAGVGDGRDGEGGGAATLQQDKALSEDAARLTDILRTIYKREYFSDTPPYFAWLRLEGKGHWEEAERRIIEAYDQGGARAAYQAARQNFLINWREGKVGHAAGVVPPLEEGASAAAEYEAEKRRAQEEYDRQLAALHVAMAGAFQTAMNQHRPSWMEQTGGKAKKGMLGWWAEMGDEEEKEAEWGRQRPPSTGPPPAAGDLMAQEGEEPDAVVYGGEHQQQGDEELQYQEPFFSTPLPPPAYVGQPPLPPPPPPPIYREDAKEGGDADTIGGYGGVEYPPHQQQASPPVNDFAAPSGASISRPDVTNSTPAPRRAPQAAIISSSAVLPYDAPMWGPDGPPLRVPSQPASVIAPRTHARSSSQVPSSIRQPSSLSSGRQPVASTAPRDDGFSSPISRHPRPHHHKQQLSWAPSGDRPALVPAEGRRSRAQTDISQLSLDNPATPWPASVAGSQRTRHLPSRGSMELQEQEMRPSHGARPSVDRRQPLQPPSVVYPAQAPRSSPPAVKAPMSSMGHAQQPSMVPHHGPPLEAPGGPAPMHGRKASGGSQSAAYYGGTDGATSKPAPPRLNTWYETQQQGPSRRQVQAEDHQPSPPDPRLIRRTPSNAAEPPAMTASAPHRRLPSQQQSQPRHLPSQNPLPHHHQRRPSPNSLRPDSQQAPMEHGSSSSGAIELLGDYNLDGDAYQQEAPSRAASVRQPPGPFPSSSATSSPQRRALVAGGSATSGRRPSPTPHQQNVGGQTPSPARRSPLTLQGAKSEYAPRTPPDHRRVASVVRTVGDDGGHNTDLGYHQQFEAAPYSPTHRSLGQQQQHRRAVSHQEPFTTRPTLLYEGSPRDGRRGASPQRGRAVSSQAAFAPHHTRSPSQPRPLYGGGAGQPRVPAPSSPPSSYQGPRGGEPGGPPSYYQEEDDAYLHQDVNDEVPAPSYSYQEHGTDGGGQEAYYHHFEAEEYQYSDDEGLAGEALASDDVDGSWVGGHAQQQPAYRPLTHHGGIAHPHTHQQSLRVLRASSYQDQQQVVYEADRGMQNSDLPSTYPEEEGDPQAYYGSNEDQWDGQVAPPQPQQVPPPPPTKQQQQYYSRQTPPRGQVQYAHAPGSHDGHQQQARRTPQSSPQRQQQHSSPRALASTSRHSSPQRMTPVGDVYYNQRPPRTSPVALPRGGAATAAAMHATQRRVPRSPVPDYSSQPQDARQQHHKSTTPARKGARGQGGEYHHEEGEEDTITASPYRGGAAGEGVMDTTLDTTITEPDAVMMASSSKCSPWAVDVRGPMDVEASGARWTVTVTDGAIHAKDMGPRSAGKDDGEEHFHHHHHHHHHASPQGKEDRPPALSPIQGPLAMSEEHEAAAAAADLQVELMMIETLIRFVVDGIELGQQGQQEAEAGAGASHDKRSDVVAVPQMPSPLFEAPSVSEEDLEADMTVLEEVVHDVLDIANHISPPQT